MSEKRDLGRPAIEEETPSNDNFPDRQMEAQPGVFVAGQKRINQDAPEFRDVPSEDLERFGDSRPDLIDPDSAHFDDISSDPRMTTTRDPADQPEVRREDPELLARQRVDQDDEWAARPTGIEYSKEEAVIRRRVTKKGDESEGL